MPNSFTDVNFIPDEVVSSRKHETQIKSLNKFAIASMFISLILGFGIFGYNMYTSNNITAVETEIASEKSRIVELNEFAESGYKLGNRLSTIKQILNNRAYHWKIFDEIYEMIPLGVEVENIQVSDNGVVLISGSSFPNYIPIAVFQDNLKTADKGYFSDVRLRSAALDKTAGDVSFTIEFLVDLNKTYEPIR